MSFNAYTAEYVGVSTTMKLFILRANPTAPKTLEGGHLYHLVSPEFSASHVPGTKRKIGTIAKEDIARFETECCQADPAPHTRLTLGGKQLYPGTQLYRCGDWLRDVQKLAFEKGIIKR
ncbi:hypothetical protein PDE_03109 [Penicillium oxalicum 114-2]|uniref:Uncharacterized protein n=1 Tax=Penicillium oxalicum (strain 114-2 / CGMCC 5302) TaxID=933388 RepID=S8AQD1_PENO1|nr:hypothetical protein PDE_03109 [Penicillium oxalicum 114-2]